MHDTPKQSMDNIGTILLCQEQRAHAQKESNDHAILHTIALFLHFESYSATPYMVISSLVSWVEMGLLGRLSHGFASNEEEHPAPVEDQRMEEATQYRAKPSYTCLAYSLASLTPPS